jgi:O-antigen/teichoic acid export membrane protein
MLGRLGSLAVGFGTSIMLADWLGAGDRGLLGIVLTASNVAYVLVGFGLPLAVTYYSSRKDVDDSPMLAITVLCSIAIALVFVPGAWLLEGPLSRLLASGHGGTWVWVLTGVLVPVSFLAWTTSNQLLGKLRFERFNALNVLSRVATLVLAVALVGVLHEGVAGAILATIAASVVIIVGSLPVVRVPGAWRPDRALFRKLLSYGAKVQVGTLLQSLNYRLDVLVLGLFAPLEQVGYYFVAEFLAELVVTVASAFQTSVIPLVSHYEGDDRQQQTTITALRHNTILTVGATLANAVFSPIVILFLLNGGYRPGLVQFFILLPSMLFLGTGVLVQGDVRGRGRPGLASVYGGIAVVVTVALDFTLIPMFGANGAAVASVCAYVVYGVVSLRGLSRLVGVPVRTLVVPTREDLALYLRVPHLVLRQLRPAPAPS